MKTLQRTTKNYQSDVEAIKEVARILQRHHTKHTKGFSSDIKKFVQEALDIISDSKNYTPERCAKLAAAIQSYFSINDIPMDDAVKSLLDGFASVLENREVMVLFSKSAARVIELLHTYEKRVFGDAEVYFVDEDGMKELVHTRDSLLALFTRETDKRRFSINKLVNLLNPDSVAHKYSIKLMPKSQQINRIESVESYLDANYIVWRNTRIKQHEEMLKTHKFDDVTKAKIQREHDSELALAEEEYKYILERFEEIDVRITGYEHETLYPSIAVTTASKAFEKHLRSEVPNALLFAPRPFRQNMKVKEFIDEAQHAFGNVYYQNRPKPEKLGRS